MSETTRRSAIVGATLFLFFGAVVFLVGALLGYCQGALGSEGSAERGFDWAVKTGLLLVVMSTVAGGIGALAFSWLRLPAFIGWALVMGLTFAIMNGGGVLLGVNEKEFWPETLGGLLQGVVVGAIAGPLIQRVQARRIQKTQQLAGQIPIDPKST